MNPSGPHDAALRLAREVLADTDPVMARVVYDREEMELLAYALIMEWESNKVLRAALKGET